MRPFPIAVPRRRARTMLGVLAVACTASLIAPVGASAATPRTAPRPGAYGYFVDTYKTNTPAATTPETNAAIGVLSPFGNLWRPGATWDSGVAVDAAGQRILDSNIAQAAKITQTRKDAQGREAYLIDRRNQSYSAIAGFGDLSGAVRTATNAGTTIPDEIPADATIKQYVDQGNANGSWADVDSELGDVVQLVNTLRGDYSSASNAKKYYQYPRPYRQSSDVKVLPELVPEESPTPATDGGFPSGHTNAGYLATLAFAYAYPEKYTELLTNGSEIGNSRIVAGMHSPLDVMGGRVLSTALAAAILNDPANMDLEQQGHQQAEKVLATATPTAVDQYADYAADKADYRKRLTYGFKRSDRKTIPATVPKGAEALLRTRLPYLSDKQIREVLRTTALPSGYPLLDDAEGWGRLDLFSAASGYGAFDGAVTVSMDAAEKGLDAADTWRNNIGGTGSLTKRGTGTLALTGTNRYTGGTTVRGGTLAADAADSLGKGSVTTVSGTLADASTKTIHIGGNLTQRSHATLSLGVDGPKPALRVAGTASLGGKLVVHVTKGKAVANDIVLIAADRIAKGTSFRTVRVTGLPAGYKPVLERHGKVLRLINANAKKHGHGHRA
ncbi:acid phosphatase [Frondihabitans sp. Leaf304]|uniref:acid phosphatase n=1 Tax=Frondihabitans sp. Leaf304 TaxID=1736329 RepID=UPI002E0E0EB6